MHLPAQHFTYSEDHRSAVVAVSSDVVHWHNAAGQRVLRGKTVELVYSNIIATVVR